MLLKTVLDFSGAILSFSSTICFVRTNIWGWPLGLAACLINLILYTKVGIYADAGLRLFFAFLMLYGWYKWSVSGTKKHKKTLAVKNLTIDLFKKIVIIGSFGFIAIYGLLLFYTDSKLPICDALTTVLSLIAQWMACHKIKQNWYVWFISDAFTCGMCFYKGIPAHATLYFVYLTIALIGAMSWQKRLLAQESNLGTANNPAM